MLAVTKSQQLIRFVTPTPRLIGRKFVLAATSPNTAFQYEFFDNTLKNKPDHHNRMGYRKNPNLKVRIRRAAHDERADLCLSRQYYAASFC